jgi:hypothetical protein
LGLVGTPHGTPYPRFGPPKLAKSRRIKEIPPKTPLTLEPRKPQNRAPLLTDLGGESIGKEPQRVQAYIPHQTPKRKASKSFQENRQERAPKSLKRTNGKDTSKPRGTTSNHLYIPKRFIQGLACHPIILPLDKISP